MTSRLVVAAMFVLFVGMCPIQSSAQTNVATGGAIIDGSSSWNAAAINAGTFPGSHAIDGRNDDIRIGADESYWLAANGDTSPYFVLDLGQVRDVRSVALYNTHNTGSNDRGTRTFQLRGSNNLGAITGGSSSEPVILASTLTSSMGGNNDTLLPGDFFSPLNGLTRGSFRYLRFEGLTSTFNTSGEYAGGAVAPNNAFGLNEFEVYETSIPANVAAGKPIIDGSSSWNGNAFNAGPFAGSSITDQQVDYFRNDANPVRTSYWLGSQSANNEFLTVDLGGLFRIDRLELQNGNNNLGGAGDRGTQNFQIFAAPDGVDPLNLANYSLILSDVLTDTRNGAFASGQDIPFDTFSSANGDFTQFDARYLRFVAVDFYGVAGSGLAELRAFAIVIPEPTSLALFALGLGCAIPRRRRRRRR